MPGEIKRSSVSPADATTQKRTKSARRKSIFAKLALRPSLEQPTPAYVHAHSDDLLSSLLSPTRQTHKSYEEVFNGDDEFRPPAFFLEQLEQARKAQDAAQMRRHSVSSDSQRIQTHRLLEKMEKMRAFDDLIRSGKTQTIKLSLTPELAI